MHLQLKNTRSWSGVLRGYCNTATIALFVDQVFQVKQLYTIMCERRLPERRGVAVVFGASRFIDVSEARCRRWGAQMVRD